MVTDGARPPTNARAASGPEKPTIRCRTVVARAGPASSDCRSARSTSTASRGNDGRLQPLVDLPDRRVADGGEQVAGVLVAVGGRAECLHVELAGDVEERVGLVQLVPGRCTLDQREDL